MENPEFFHQGVIFHQEHYVVMLPKARSYTGFEKLVFPFDRETWICIVLIFLCGFCVIFIVNFQAQNIQEIVYGEKIASPTFNLIGNFFGISQDKLPETFFARILFLIFVFYCLVMRTAYQGEIY